MSRLPGLPDSVRGVPDSVIDTIAGLLPWKDRRALARTCAGLLRASRRWFRTVMVVSPDSHDFSRLEEVLRVSTGENLPKKVPEN